MGSDEGASVEQPVHEVFLDAFWMDEHQVTVEQYKKFVQETNYADTPCGTGNHPAACINWYAAQAYCEWAGKRLPTEAEWENAAQGGSKWFNSSYPWGDEKPICVSGAENGAQFSHCEDGTVSVKTFSPNGFGLYDMAGNVWEWVADWYEADYYINSPHENPEGPVSGEYRVLRGGSWLEDESFLSYYYRGGSFPENQSDNIGFRCASPE